MRSPGSGSSGVAGRFGFWLMCLVTWWGQEEEQKIYGLEMAGR
jgi:hypothetical protein